MGGLLSCLGPESDAEGDAPKQYSWDKREATNPEDYTYKGLRGESVGKVPGSVNSGQFIIDDCQDCNIYVCDDLASTTIDDCSNCRIFLGPNSGSVFIRNCKDCKLILACQQFRTRDCTNIEVLLCCPTLPIIEATTGIKFGSFRATYFTLGGQFSKAGLSMFNNNWARIHDFTPSKEEANWTMTDEEPAWLAEFFSFGPEDIKALEIDTSATSSTVPVTSSIRGKKTDESALLVFFHPAEKHAKKFLLNAYNAGQEFQVIQSREMPLDADKCTSIFGQDFVEPGAKGPVVGMELNGVGIIAFAESICGQLKSPIYYLSKDGDGANQDIEAFFAHADAGMKV